MSMKVLFVIAWLWLGRCCAAQSAFDKLAVTPAQLAARARPLLLALIHPDCPHCQVRALILG